MISTNLLLVMFPKVSLTSHSRIPGSRWVITASWLFGSLISFLYSVSLYFCHLFLTSSASVRSLNFLSCYLPIFAWSVPLVSPLSLKRSILFAILFSSNSCTIHLWRVSYLSLLFSESLHSTGYIFFFLSPLPFTSLIFSAIFKASLGNHFAFSHLFLLSMVLMATSQQCCKPPSTVLQANWSNPLNLFFISTI